MPNEGDTIAVVHTTLGDFTMRFFPEQAPKTVTNFINLAKRSYKLLNHFLFIFKALAVFFAHMDTATAFG